MEQRHDVVSGFPRTEVASDQGARVGLSLPAVLAMFLRHWRAVLLGLLGGLALALVYIFALPPVYVANVVIVPSVERGGGNMLAAQLPPGLAGLAGGGDQDQQKLIMAIVRSRRLAESIYTQLWPTETSEDAKEFFVRQLPNRTEVSQTAAGSYVIQVRDREPELAAAIANAYPALINEISADLGRQVVNEKQEFLQDQLQEARGSLIASEEQVLNYQRSTDAPAVQEQARQTVEAAAELQREIMRREVEVSQLRRSATPSNPELRAAISQVEALRAQLRTLTAGQNSGDVFLSLEESPEIKAGEVRLLREFATNEQIYLALTAALAETQIDARTNLPVVSVLDSAPVPEHSARLSAPIVLFLLGWLGLMGGLLLALLAEYRDRLARDPESSVLRDAWRDVRGDFGRFRGRGKRPASA